MARFRPARWAATQAATGLRDLPRNSLWLLSQGLRSPVAATESAAQEATDGLRRMTIAVADKVSGAPDSVTLKIKRAETAVVRAKEAEQQALTEAQAADERAAVARSVSEAGKQRIREATREGSRKSTGGHRRRASTSAAWSRRNGRKRARRSMTGSSG